MERASTSVGFAGGPESLDHQLGARRGIVLTAVLLVAALVRIVGFVELNHGPILEFHRWEETDMSFFDRWAKGIAAGDLLSERTGHPQHAPGGIVNGVFVPIGNLLCQVPVSIGIARDQECLPQVPLQCASCRQPQQ